MRFHWAILAATLLAASPARAERLQFDHRLYPPLKQVLDSGDQGMVHFNASNPARLVDLIAVKGRSAKSWTEALEIIALSRPRDVPTVADWKALIEKQSLARCKATFEILAQSENSITFERRSTDCRAERANTALYRLVTGKRSWFQLTVLSKNALDPEARRQWLELLASARLE